MRAAELAETALSMRSVSSEAEDSWTTFEVIENGELGRREAGGPGSALSSFFGASSGATGTTSCVETLSDVTGFFFFLQLSAPVFIRVCF